MEEKDVCKIRLIKKPSGYPKLMVSNMTGLVVLMTDWKCGVVIREVSKNPLDKLGDYFEDWAEEAFIPVTQGSKIYFYNNEREGSIFNLMSRLGKLI